jgi:hypothetical protein
MHMVSVHLKPSMQMRVLGFQKQGERSTKILELPAKKETMSSIACGSVSRVVEHVEGLANPQTSKQAHLGEARLGKAHPQYHDQVTNLACIPIEKEECAQRAVKQRCRQFSEGAWLHSYRVHQIIVCVSRL